MSKQSKTTFSRLNRTKEERLRMFKSMLISICSNQDSHITTYTTRLKVTKRNLEKIVARAKIKLSISVFEAERYLHQFLHTKTNVKKVLDKISRLKLRKGGYFSLRKLEIDRNQNEISVLRFSDKI